VLRLTVIRSLRWPSRGSAQRAATLAHMPSAPDPENVLAVIARQAEVIEKLEDRIRALESKDVGPSISNDGDDSTTSTRRNLLKTLGIAAVTGTIGANVIAATPAAAADGGSYTGTQTTFINNTSVATTAGVRGEFSGANGTGVIGVANAGTKAAGVNGVSTSGFGVFGETVTGYAVYSAGRLGLASYLISGAPITGSTDPLNPSPGFALGDIVRNSAGDTWSCVVANVDSVGNTILGAVAQFRKIAGPESAGQWHPVTSPLTVYDNRFFNGAPGTGGKHGIGETRTVNLRLNNGFPAGATAVTLNVLVWSTEGSGFFAMIPGDATWNGIGQVYWQASNQFITYPTPIRVQRTGGQALAKIITGASCNVTIELNGYYL
jgi:hypothetical protein